MSWKIYMSRISGRISGQISSVFIEPENNSWRPLMLCIGETQQSLSRIAYSTLCTCQIVLKRTFLNIMTSEISVCQTPTDLPGKKVKDSSAEKMFLRRKNVKTAFVGVQLCTYITSHNGAQTSKCSNNTQNTCEAELDTTTAKALIRMRQVPCNGKLMKLSGNSWTSLTPMECAQHSRPSNAVGETVAVWAKEGHSRVHKRGGHVIRGGDTWYSQPISIPLSEDALCSHAGQSLPPFRRHGSSPCSCILHLDFNNQRGFLLNTQLQTE